MSASPKEKLELADAEAQAVAESDREVYLREGRTLTVSDRGADQLVEIRNESGLVELRVQLTEQGPVLQMESVRLSLKATESLAIESPKVTIVGTEALSLQSGGELAITAQNDIKVTANSGEVRVVGTMIYLN